MLAFAPLESSLRSKLEHIVERHEELASMLCDSEIVANKSRFLELSREHADLDTVAQAYLALTKHEADLEGLRELLEDPDMREMAEADAAELRDDIERMTGEVQRLLIPKDPNDSKNVVLEIRAGAGGDEAALFAADLWRMYSRHAEQRRWTVEPMGHSESPSGGFREVAALIRGKDVYGTLKFESGAHRVQRVPVTESQGRIHTSTATVAVMPEAEEVDVEINPSDLRIDVMRSSGAGGQHVNTTDSAVRITHLPTNIAVHCQQEKSQIKNREIAMALLRSRILDREIQRVEAERAAHRKNQVGTGDRSEKVRTYNYPQDRVTDHRIGMTRHNLSGFIDGDILDVIEALRAEDEASRMAELKES